MQTDINKIKDILEGYSDVLKSTYGVSELGIFGSVAKKQNTNLSDIDILVGFSKPVGFFKFIELEDYLSRILGNKVDLVTRNALKPIIKEEVLKEVIYV